MLVEKTGTDHSREAFTGDIFLCFWLRLGWCEHAPLYVVRLVDELRSLSNGSCQDHVFVENKSCKVGRNSSTSHVVGTGIACALVLPLTCFPTGSESFRDTRFRGARGVLRVCTALISARPSN